MKVLNPGSRGPTGVVNGNRDEALLSGGATASGRARAVGFLAFAMGGALLLLLLGASPGLGQDLGDPKYQFQTREVPDRMEGLRPMDRSGEYIDLVGAFYNAPMIRGARTSGNRWRIGFFLSRPEARIEIRVRDRNRFRADHYQYWMLPAREAFGAGFQEFAWDASIARELGLGLDDLDGIAWVRGRGDLSVAPLILTSAPFPSLLPTEGVRFVFVPSETMTVDYEVRPLGKPSRTVWSSEGERWEKGQRNSIRWPGRGRDGKPAAEGAYVLALRAKYATRSGLEERIPLEYVFHYRPEVMIGR